MKNLTLENIENMRDGHKKNCYYELYHINDKLKRMMMDNENIDFTLEILKQSADYTKHIKVVMLSNKDVKLENTDIYNWYYHDSYNSFKNWSECYQYLKGYRNSLTNLHGY